MRGTRERGERADDLREPGQPIARVAHGAEVRLEIDRGDAVRDLDGPHACPPRKVRAKAKRHFRARLSGDELLHRLGLSRAGPLHLRELLAPQEVDGELSLRSGCRGRSKWREDRGDGGERDCRERSERPGRHRESLRNPCCVAVRPTSDDRS